MLSARNRQPAKQRRPRVVPVDIVIPLHCNAIESSIELPALAAKAPARVTKSDAAPKRKTKAKTKKKVASPRRKAAAKPRARPRATSPVIALPQRSEPLTEPTIDLAAWSALAPPPIDAALAPGPIARQSRALALYHGGSLIDALADWLGTRTRQLWRQIGALGRPAPKRRMRLGLVPRMLPPPDAELQRLKAENEQLRLQLEALLALQSSAGGNRAPSPA